MADATKQIRTIFLSRWNRARLVEAPPEAEIS